MKKIAILMASALVLWGCGSASEHSVDTPSSYQQAQTGFERTYELHSGTVKITCEYDEAGDEHCSGIYEATGEAVPSDVVNEVVESPHIDPKIEQAIEGGCENKILVLSCELRDGYPEIAFPAPGEPDNPKNKEFIQKQQEARNQAMDEFVAANPGLLSEATINGYKSGSSIFDFNLNACDYADFIKKNKYKLYILELHGVVDNPPREACSNEIDYNILFNENNNFGPSDNTGSYKIFETADAYHQFIDSKKQYISWEGFDFDAWAEKMKAYSQKIDFAKDNLIAIESEVSSGSAKLRVMEACDGKLEADITWCAGKAMTADVTYPMMIARIAKGAYQVTVGAKGLACDDSYEPLPGMVPEQKDGVKGQPDMASCDSAISYEILKQTNLGGSGEFNWNKQSAHVFHDMASFEAYLDTLRAAHLGEWMDGLTHEIHYSFDPEEFKDFDFNNYMLVALEGGSQPSGGYGMRIESACNNKVVYNVVWCDAPDIGYTADIGYPFILASFAKGDYEFAGGNNSKYCD